VEEGRGGVCARQAGHSAQAMPARVGVSRFHASDVNAGAGLQVAHQQGLQRKDMADNTSPPVLSHPCLPHADSPPIPPPPAHTHTHLVQALP
jgi:hypothetical protein